MLWTVNSDKCTQLTLQITQYGTCVCLNLSVAWELLHLSLAANSQLHTQLSHNVIVALFPARTKIFNWSTFRFSVKFHVDSLAEIDSSICSVHISKVVVWSGCVSLLWYLKPCCRFFYLVLTQEIENGIPKFYRSMHTPSSHKTIISLRVMHSHCLYK